MSRYDDGEDWIFYTHERRARLADYGHDPDAGITGDRLECLATEKAEREAHKMGLTPPNPAPIIYRKSGAALQED